MSRPAFYFCICPDSGLIKRHIETLILQYPAENGQSLMPSASSASAAKWERHVYWGDSELPKVFWEHLTLQGLFGVPRLLVLRNAHQVPAATWKQLSQTLGRPNSQSWLIVCLEGAWEKRQPKLPAHIAKLQCLTFADKKGWIWRHSGLESNSIKSYIVEKAVSLNLTIDRDALDALSANVLPDAISIDGELQKLSLLANNGQVTSDMVGSGAYVPESNIFSFISYIQAGNISAAWREIYRSQKDVDALFFPFLALLAREVKLLWQILAGEQVRVHPQALREKESYAKGLGYAGIAEILSAIVRAEFYVKSGERSVEQSLESLVADLVLLFNVNKRG